MNQLSVNHLDRDNLLKRKAEIQAEINSYPAPIAGCDQQFNHLLEMRAQVRKQLQILDDPSKQPGIDR